MSRGKIGIKIADGSFYPVLEDDFTGRMKLVLTTVRDNQETVQIDLYRGDSEKAEEADYVGSLVVENIPPAPKSDPEIEVLLGIDDNGNLEATASDILTGERQSLSASLESLESEDLYSIPDFEIEEEGGLDLEEPADADGEKPADEDSLLTGETYPIGPVDRRKEHLVKQKKSPLMLIGFVLLGLLIIAAVTYLIFKSFGGAGAPALQGGKEVTEQSTSQEAGSGEAASEAGEAASGETVKPEVTKQPVVVSLEKKSTASAAVSYLIKKGDTLWDIASTYYRNPWLYPKIARANGLPNPDLIFAGETITIPEN